MNGEYEEYAVHDTDNFPCEVPEYISIDELNQMYEMIEELPEEVVDSLDDFISYYGSLEGVVEHKDQIYFYPDCDSMEDVARYFVDELQTLGEIPPSLQDYMVATWKSAVILSKPVTACAKFNNKLSDHNPFKGYSDSFSDLRADGQTC